MATFLILGFALYKLLTEFYPDSDPFIVFNGFLILLDHHRFTDALFLSEIACHERKTIAHITH